jgi:hypothetical protein
MRNKTFLGFLTVLACLGISQAQDFPKAMKKVFSDKQFKDYQWSNYPLDDYGVGTAYKGTSNQITGGSFLCATFTCLNIKKPDVTKADSLTSWLIIASDPADATGYADKGCGGAVEANLKKNSKWALNGLVPQMLGILGLSGEANSDKSAKIDLVFSRACNRKLLQVKAIQYFTNMDHQDTYGVRTAYNNNALVLVLEDVVITSFDVKVVSNSQLKAGLDAKLKQDPTGKFGKDAELKFSLEKSNDTEYHLKSDSPVIVGFLPASNHNVPVGKGVGPGFVDNWAGWQHTTIELPQTSKGLQ